MRLYQHFARIVGLECQFIKPISMNSLVNKGWIRVEMRLYQHFACKVGLECQFVKQISMNSFTW